MKYKKKVEEPKKHGHASQRAKERMNLELTPKYARQICRDIIRGNATLIETQDGDKQKWEVLVNGNLVTVIWGVKNRRIITIW